MARDEVFDAKLILNFLNGKYRKRLLYGEYHPQRILCLKIHEILLRMKQKRAAEI